MLSFLSLPSKRKLACFAWRLVWLVFCPLIFIGNISVSRLVRVLGAGRQLHGPPRPCRRRLCKCSLTRPINSISGASVSLAASHWLSRVCASLSSLPFSSLICPSAPCPCRCLSQTTTLSFTSTRLNGRQPRSLTLSTKSHTKTTLTQQCYL